MDVLFPASSPSPNPLNLLPFSQHNLTKSMEYCYYNDLWGNSSPPNRAWILSCSDKHSYTVLTALPYNQGFELSDQAVRIFMVNRLQLDLPSASLWGTKCFVPNCRMRFNLDPVGIHFSSCPAGAGAKTKRHDRMKLALRSAMSAAGCNPVVEAHGVYGSNQQRADLWLSDGLSEASPPVAVDVTVTDPRCTSHLPRSAIERLFAAGVVEAKKVTHYRRNAEARGSLFHAWALEASGAWGSSASSVFNSLAVLASDRGIHSASFKKFWSTFLAVAYARAQSAFLLASSSRLLREANPPSANPDPANSLFLDSIRVGQDLIS